MTGHRWCVVLEHGETVTRCRKRKLCFLPLKEDLRTSSLLDKDLAESLCGDGWCWTPVPANIDVARKLKQAISENFADVSPSLDPAIGWDRDCQSVSL